MAQEELVDQEARAVREVAAVLEALAPPVPLDPQEELVDQVALADPAGRAAWVRPVPRAVQVVQAVREGRVVPEEPEG